MSLVVLLTCLETQSRTYDGPRSKLSPPWPSSVRWYILACTKADRAAEDLQAKIVETDVLGHFVGLLQESDSAIRQSSVETITILAEIGM